MAARPTRRATLFGAFGAFTAAVGATTAIGWAARANELKTRRRVGLAFNTPFDLTVAGPDARLLDAALDEAVVALREVERATSVYVADGEVARLNRDGVLRAPHDHLVRLLTYGADLSRTTGGRFDCTVQPLWELWAAHKARSERPDASALRDTVRRVDWRGIDVHPAAVRLLGSGMAVTLNSINQGYAVDVVMAVLSACGIEHAFVNTGEFGARGRSPEGRDWRLGVAAPRDPDRLAYVIDPCRRCVATSGDYKTYFSPDFRDHHIFTPQTGVSPSHWSAITVEADTGLEADALSTALFTLEPDGARELLRAYPRSRARFFNKAGEEEALEA